jgi:copper resistance protein B
MKTPVSILLLNSCINVALAQHVHEPAPAATAADPHAGHAMPAKPQASAPVLAAEDPHAGHTMPMPAAPPESVDPHAGHNMPGMNTTGTAPVETTDAHAGHDMSVMSGATDMGNMNTMEEPPPAEAFSGPVHAADLLFDAGTMATTRDALRNAHGGYKGLFAMADRFEVQDRDGDSLTLWDAQGWYGTDENRLWLKTEGEVTDHDEEFELQALWSHAFHPWFDFQAGLRLDFNDGLDTSHLAVGIQGLLPYRFETDAALFLSEDGDLSARIEGEYDWWLTQRLILQPRIELNLSAQDIPAKAIGAGVQNIELGLRLRYQIRREFAPYVGIEYSRLYGDTADYTRRSGREVSDSYAVLGIQAWF